MPPFASRFAEFQFFRISADTGGRKGRKAEILRFWIPAPLTRRLATGARSPFRPLANPRAPRNTPPQPVRYPSLPRPLQRPTGGRPLALFQRRMGGAWISSVILESYIRAQVDWGGICRLTVDGHGASGGLRCILNRSHPNFQRLHASLGLVVYMGPKVDALRLLGGRK